MDFGKALEMAVYVELGVICTNMVVNRRRFHIGGECPGKCPGGNVLDLTDTPLVQSC